MFRLWGKIWKDNHLLKDTVICDDSEGKPNLAGIYSQTF